MFRCSYLVVVLTTFFAVESRAEVLFQDEFDNPVAGIPRDWNQVGSGGVIVSEGSLTLSDDSLLPKGFFDTADVSIRTRLRISDGDAGLAGRVGMGNYFVQLGERGFLTLGDTDGTPQIRESPALDPASHDVILHLDLFGQEISVTAWEVGRPQTAHTISFIDDTRDAGPFAIWTNGQAEFRWFQAVSESSDCNDDGSLDVLDMNCTSPELLNVNLTALGLIPGDADGNGKVEFADFLRLSANFGASGQYTDGDFDKNGEVQFADFLILSSQFGQSAATAATVPEPSAIFLTLLGVTAVLGKLTRKTSKEPIMA